MMHRYRKPPRPLKNVSGGYRLISTEQICMAWSAYRHGDLAKYLHLRVYLALHEIAERREAESRRQARAQLAPRVYCYNRQQLLKEVHRLVGGEGGRCLREAFSRLERLGLVECDSAGIGFPQSPEHLPESVSNAVSAMLRRIDQRPHVSQRLVPVPRRMLRCLARETAPCVAATVLALSFRCLWLKDGRCSNAGICSVRFAADVFGVHERSVKRANQHLRKIGWIHSGCGAESSSSPSRASRVVINLDWAPAVIRVVPAEALSTCTDVSPRARQNGTDLSPPIINVHLLSGSENQHPAARGRAGVLKKDFRIPKPSLRCVIAEDLREPARLGLLFGQAVGEGILADVEADRLQFFAAARHAVEHGTSNPCGLFVVTVRERRWGFITQADEDAARASLARLRGTLLPSEQRSTNGRDAGVDARRLVSSDPRTNRLITQLAAMRVMPQGSGRPCEPGLETDGGTLCA